MKTLFKYGDLVTPLDLHREDKGTLGVVVKVTDIGLPKFPKSQVLKVKWISGKCVDLDRSYYDTSLELVAGKER